MTEQRFGIITKSFSLISMAALVTALYAAPARCADADASTAVPAAASSSTASNASAIHKTLKRKVKAVVNALRAVRDKEFAKAAPLFPAFCKDWERKLHDRQTNNESHITWQAKNGWETGSYTGYGPITKCECHQSSDGFSIGTVSYDEFQYYLAGKTEDEAKHAAPRVTDSTATTELFRWDKDAWFY